MTSIPTQVTSTPPRFALFLRNRDVHSTDGYKVKRITQFDMGEREDDRTDNYITGSMNEKGRFVYQIRFCNKGWTLTSLDIKPTCDDTDIFYAVCKSCNKYVADAVYFNKTESQARIEAHHWYTKHVLQEH